MIQLPFHTSYSSTLYPNTLPKVPYLAWKKRNGSSSTRRLQIALVRMSNQPSSQVQSKPQPSRNIPTIPTCIEYNRISTFIRRSAGSNILPPPRDLHLARTQQLFRIDTSDEYRKGWEGTRAWSKASGGRSAGESGCWGIKEYVATALTPRRQSSGFAFWPSCSLGGEKA